MGWDVGYQMDGSERLADFLRGEFDRSMPKTHRTHSIGAHDTPIHAIDPPTESFISPRAYACGCVVWIETLLKVSPPCVDDMRSRRA